MKRFTLSAAIILIASVFLLPFSAMAQWRGTPENYVTFKAGVYTPTGDLEDDDFDPGFNGEVVFGHYFGPYFALEGGIGYFQTEGSQPVIAIVTVFDPLIGFYDAFVLDDLDLTVSVVPLTVTAKGVIPAKPAEFYIGAGAGIYFVKVDGDLRFLGDTDSDDDAVWGAHLLAGVNFDLNDLMFFGLEGKYIITDEADATLFSEKFGGDLNGFMVTGNLGFRF